MGVEQQAHGALTPPRRQRRWRRRPVIEVVRHGAVALEQTQARATGPGRFARDQGREPHHRLARLADHQVFAGGGFLHQEREVGPGLVQVHLAHADGCGGELSLGTVSQLLIGPEEGRHDPTPERGVAFSSSPHPAPSITGQPSGLGRRAPGTAIPGGPDDFKTVIDQRADQQGDGEGAGGNRPSVSSARDCGR
jgi:hypothetical protein